MFDHSGLFFFSSVYFVHLSLFEMWTFHSNRNYICLSGINRIDIHSFRSDFLPRRWTNIRPWTFDGVHLAAVALHLHLHSFMITNHSLARWRSLMLNVPRIDRISSIRVTLTSAWQEEKLETKFPNMNMPRTITCGLTYQTFGAQ